MKTSAHRILLSLLLPLFISACSRHVQEKSVIPTVSPNANTPPVATIPTTTFPQIHTNLNGMVREFVRCMYQDSKGNYWFGTNGNGIIRYDGQTLENVIVQQHQRFVSVRKIVEDKAGNVWFGTSSGLVKYDGEAFTTYSTEAGLQDEEIWGLTIDRNSLMWVGSNGGASHFDGQRFKPFPLPETAVEHAQPMLSIKRVSGFVEDRDGNMWISTDGNGIFRYGNGAFTHLTKENGLTDNHAGAALQDKSGNIWIGSFYGGTSKFDGNLFTNFTQAGLIEGIETGSFYEDRKGNIWFSAEGLGVYRYDGTAFKLFTTEDGLTSNVVQSIFEDQKGQLWFGTWQGLCIFDGEKFVNAAEKEPWTK